MKVQLSQGWKVETKSEKIRCGTIFWRTRPVGGHKVRKDFCETVWDNLLDNDDIEGETYYANDG